MIRNIAVGFRRAQNAAEASYVLGESRVVSFRTRTGQLRCVGCWDTGKVFENRNDKINSEFTRAKQERDSDEEGVDIDEDDILVSTLADRPMIDRDQIQPGPCPAGDCSRGGAGSGLAGPRNSWLPLLETAER